MHLSIATLAALGTAVSAFELPDNLRAIYDAHKSGECQSALSEPFNTGAVYCGDIPNAVFLKGPDGEYDNMDVDCDGANNSGGDCANDPSGQGQTSFVDIVSKFGIQDLDANIHSYVVFGNEGDNPSFAPQDHGIQPLSVMAVVCNDQVFYGVWGDTNGFTSTGESSLALAKLCFPNDGLNGDSGHDENDVLYIAFTGDEAVPGRDGANWSAGSAEEFEDSLKELGDRLVASLPS